MKQLIFRNTLARRGPHIGYIDVLLAAVCCIKPARAHSSTDVVCPRLFGDRRKSPVSIVAVEIAAAEVVRNIEIRPAVAIDVAPGASEAVTIILGTEAAGFCEIYKRAIALVVKEEVRRAVARVEIRRRVVILVEPEIIGIKAEIDVEFSVAVVVGNGRVC